MKRTSPLLRLLALLFGFTLVVAACGDDDSDAGGEAETGQDEAATTAGGDEGTTAGAEDEGTEPGGDVASGDLPDEFFSDDCQEAYSAFLGAQTQMGGAFTGQTGDLEEARASIEAMADNAPDEIADAMETFAAEMSVFFDALADIGLDGSGQPTAEQMSQLMQISETVDEAALDQAADEISAYFDEVCAQQ